MHIHIHILKKNLSRSNSSIGYGSAFTPFTADQVECDFVPGKNSDKSDFI